MVGMMAFSKQKTATLISSASLLFSNLSVITQLENGTVTFGVIHKSTLNVVHTSNSHMNATEKEVAYDDSGNKDPLSHILQARWCRLKSTRVVLVLTAYKGFQILEWNGKGQLYLNKFETPQGAFRSRFARGISSVGNSVCVGTSEGTILVVNVPAEGSDVQFNRQLQGHSAPVCDIAINDEGKVASCDEAGMIIVWHDPLTRDDNALVINDAHGVTCPSLCYWSSFLIAGYVNGQIVIYDSDSGAKMIEIAAHARCINAIDVATKAGLLLSVSEDSTISVWKLPTISTPQVSQVFSTTESDSTLCGGKFCDPMGATFAITAYDSTEITTYTQILL